jgi:hypothetical protein
LVALILLPLSAQAQLISGYGVKAGLNASTTNFDFFVANTASEVKLFDSKRRIGFNVAIFAEWLKKSSFSLLTQAEYAQRGYIRDQDATGSLGAVSLEARLDYVSIPLLAKWQGSNPTLSPFIIFGPRFDFLINRQEELFQSPETDPRLDLIDETAIGYTDVLNDRALGGTIGMGVATNKILFVEVRYNFDFSDNVESEFIKAKNSAIDLWVGFKF